MANCGKCGAELIGSGKFCATCGAPAPPPATDGPVPSTTLPGTGGSPVSISMGTYEPPSAVNPFAATASPSVPGSRLDAPKHEPPPDPSTSNPAAQSTPALDGGPPPVSQSPLSSSEKSQVSPLAISNAISQRNVSKELGAAVAEAERASLTPPVEPVRKKPPGTQLMSNVPSSPVKPAVTAEEPSEPVQKKPIARTVAMGFNAAKLGFPPPGPNAATPAPPVNATPQSALGGGAPMAAGAPQSVIGGAPQSVLGGQPQSVVQPNPGLPQSVGQPSSGGHVPQSAPLEPSAGWGNQANAVAPQNFHHQAYGQPPMPAQPHAPQQAYQAPYGQPQPPAGPGGWGWNGGAMPPPAPVAGYPYPFAYAPGSRVQVTWSNGQRYPATINQMSGSQCLVVFPDGQQHWVDVQYLSPG